MDRYKQLQQARADLINEGKAIFTLADTSGRDLSDVEKTRDDEINARLVALDADLAREETRRDRERSLGASQPAASRLQVGRDLAETKPWGADTGFGFGEFLMAVHRQKVGIDFDPRLRAAAQGAGENVGADGGFAVQTDFKDMVELRMTGGEIISRCTPMEISGPSNGVEMNMIDETSRVTGSRFGAVQGYWTDEGGAPTASRPKFYKLALRLRKLAALGYATDELLNDAGALQSTMVKAFGEELKFLTEDAIIEGTGAGTPLGILISGALISVSAESGQATATLVKENIDKMWARFPASNRTNAVWFINQDVEPQLDNLQMTVGVGGVPVYLPAGGISEAPFSRLKGRPVIPIEYASTLGTKGDIILADFSQYLLATKGGPQTASSMHVAFTTDETAFRVTYRVDGQPTMRVPLTPFKGTNTQSPFVTLATR